MLGGQVQIIANSVMKNGDHVKAGEVYTLVRYVTAKSGALNFAEIQDGDRKYIIHKRYIRVLKSLKTALEEDPRVVALISAETERCAKICADAGREATAEWDAVDGSHSGFTAGNFQGRIVMAKECERRILGNIPESVTHPKCDCNHFKHCKGCEFDGVLGLRDEPCRSCKDGSNHWVDGSGGGKC